MHKSMFDDIVFGSISCVHIQEFINLMQKEFEITIVGELKIF